MAEKGGGGRRDALLLVISLYPQACCVSGKSSSGFKLRCEVWKPSSTSFLRFRSRPLIRQAGQACVAALGSRVLHNDYMIFPVFTGLSRVVLMFYSECVRRRFLVFCFLVFFLPSGLIFFDAATSWMAFLSSPNYLSLSFVHAYRAPVCILHLSILLVFLFPLFFLPE